MTALMKGNSWAKRKHKMTYPCTAEIKHDEIRVQVQYNGLAEPVSFLSYAGKPLKNLGQFGTAFHLFFQHNPEHTVLDCGFEANGNFNDSYRWVRSNGIPDDLVGVSTKFFLFDLPDLTLLPYRDRCFKRVDAHWKLATVLNIEVPEHWYCYSEADVDAAFDKARKLGYEGLMIKSNGGMYHSTPARSDGWLKYKNGETYDGKIVGFTEAVSADGVPLGRVGSVDLTLADGSTASPHGIAHELGRTMWLNQQKYLGQWVEFDAMERDRQGGYRHPVWRRLRESKD